MLGDARGQELDRGGGPVTLGHLGGCAPDELRRHVVAHAFRERALQIVHARERDDPREGQGLLSREGDIVQLAARAEPQHEVPAGGVPDGDHLLEVERVCSSATRLR